MKSIYYLTILFTAVFLLSVQAQAQTFPYTDNFNSDTVGSNAPHFVATTNNGGQSADAWTVTAGGQLHSALTTGAFGGTFATDLIGITGATSPNSFTLSSNLQLSALPAGSFSVGFDAFGLDSNLPSNFGGTGYFASVNQAGSLVIGQYSNSFNKAFTSIGGTQTGTLAALNTAATYTLTLNGTYTGSSLVLDFQVSDGTNTADVVTSSLATPLTGNFFGYQEMVSGTTTSLTGNFDNLSLTSQTIQEVPEPSEYALMLSGLGLLVFLTHRRSQTV